MQPASQLNCPGCGAPAPFRGTAVSLVCEYCGNTVVRTGVDVRLLGKVSAILDDGSPVLLGGKGTHRGVPFEIVGRLQLAHLRGRWSEWYLLFADNTAGWLSDAQGSYAITRPGDRRSVAERVPTFYGLAIGTWLEVQGTSYMVTEKRSARYQGAEGALPFEAEPGLFFFSADLAGADDEFLTLDYGTDANHRQPTPYVGGAVELAALDLKPLRTFEGWRD